MNASSLPRRLSMSALAELMIQWLKERLGDLVLVNVCDGAGNGDVVWCQADKFIERQDHIYWEDLMGCPFYVQTGDLNHLSQAGLKVEVAFERSGEVDSFSSFRLVSAIRPFTDDEAVLFQFAQERRAADTAERLIQQLRR